MKWLSTWFYFTLRFFQNKKRSGTSFPALFLCMIFEEKHFSCYVLLSDQNSLSHFMFIVIVCFQVCNFKNFEIFYSFLINPFLYMSKKSQDKNLNTWTTKWKASFIIFKFALTEANKANFFCHLQDVC